jgi:DNA mismatch endonuclease, patch repair protein
MPDIISKNARSKNMSKIHSTNTKAEMFVRSILFEAGFRYRINYKSIEGKPDIFFVKKKVAIFVHGCFWHRHSCNYAYIPKSNTNFWQYKFSTNLTRDKFVLHKLNSEQIRVLVIWECTIKKMRKDKNYRVIIVSQMTDFIFGNNLDYLEL